MTPGWSSLKNSTRRLVSSSLSGAYHTNAASFFAPSTSFWMRSLAGSAISSAKICSVFDRSDLAAEAPWAADAVATTTASKIVVTRANMTPFVIGSVVPSSHQHHQRPNAFGLLQSIGNFDDLFQCGRANAHFWLQVTHQVNGIGKAENMVAAAILHFVEVEPLRCSNAQPSALRQHSIVSLDGHSLQQTIDSCIITFSQQTAARLPID